MEIAVIFGWRTIQDVVRGFDKLAALLFTFLGQLVFNDFSVGLDLGKLKRLAMSTDQITNFLANLLLKFVQNSLMLTKRFGLKCGQDLSIRYRILIDPDVMLACRTDMIFEQMVWRQKHVFCLSILFEH